MEKQKEQQNNKNKLIGYMCSNIPLWNLGYGVSTCRMKTLGSGTIPSIPVRFAVNKRCIVVLETGTVAMTIEQVYVKRCLFASVSFLGGGNFVGMFYFYMLVLW